jgi:hypothetical protein
MKPRHLIPAVLLVALLLAYPLSLGPVLWWYRIHTKTYFPNTVILFYRPLNPFFEHVPFAAKALHGYEELWVPGMWHKIPALPPATP